MPSPSALLAASTKFGAIPSIAPDANLLNRSLRDKPVDFIS